MVYILFSTQSKEYTTDALHKDKCSWYFKTALLFSIK